MALNLPAAITVTANVQGSQTLNALARQLQALSASSQLSGRSLDRLYTETQKLGSAAGNTISSLRNQVAALRNLRDEVEFGSRRFKLLTKDIEAAEAKLKKYQATASQSGGLSRGQALLAGVAGGIAGSLTTMAAQQASNAVRGIAEAGMNAETAQVRLKALTDQFGEYNQAQAATDRIAKTLRISTTEASDGFAQLYAALRPTGVTLKETEDAYIGFTAAARASGATAAESSAALLQLKQALGSGVLQGDELRSIREQAPLVGQAIAKEMGVTVGELKKLGSEGKITSDIVLKALARLKGENLDKLNAQFNTGAQAIKDFQVATEKLGIQIAKTFGPTAVQLIQAFTRVLERASDLLGGGGNETRSRLLAQMTAQAEARRKFGYVGAFTNRAEYDAFVKQRTEALLEASQEAAARAKDKAGALTPEQKKAQEDADKEREAARERAGMEEAKKRLAEQLKIREDMEKRLADFREQSIRRAEELERDLGDQRLQLERNTAEARRKIAAQEQDAATQRERYRLESAGLSTAGLDMKQRLDEADRRYTEQKLQIQQSATERRVQIERTLEDYKLSVARGISEILQDAGDKLAAKMAAGGQAAAAAMTGAAGAAASPGGIIARTGSTGQSTGPHLDARWSDGRRITAADADRYLSVNGRDPSSYGVTSGYGPRKMFGRSFHSGIDFGTPSGSGITLKGGASLLRDLGFTGAGGYAVEIMTPQGPMRLLHLQAGSAGRPGAAGASMPGLPGVEAARGRLNAAVSANESANLAANAGERILDRGNALRDATSQLNQQVKSVREQRQDFERMVELQRSGLSPELARQVVDRERIAAAEREGLQVLAERLTSDLQSKDLTAQQRADTQAILRDTEARLAAQPDLVQGLLAEAQALEQAQKRQEQIRQLSEGIAQTVGGGLSQAFNVLISGTENWGESLRKIASDVLTQIANKLIEITLIQPLTNSLSSGLSGILGGLFGGGGASMFTPDFSALAFAANGNAYGKNGIVPFATGGIVNRPTLFKFANGGAMSTGVMGEAGPEAIMPLKRGADGKLGVAGGGGSTVVNVSVDASGSQIQGDAGKGEQLGRAVAQAVQAELIKQKRPGGLLAA